MTVRLTRAQKQQQTREHLLQAAEVLFAERGIHQTSLDDVAAAAGLTKGAVYANFDSKVGLLLALLQRRNPAEEPAGVRHAGAEAAAQVGGDVLGWQRRLGEGFVANAGTPESRLFTMAFAEFWLYGMRNSEARAALANALQAARQVNAAEAAATGFARASSELAVLVTALDIGVGLQHLIDPERVPAELFATGLRMLMSGVASE